MKFSFESRRAPGEILDEWWEGLQQDTGGRARLRRCKNPEEVMLEPAFHRLLARLKSLENKNDAGMTDSDVYRLAAVAGLLAHVTGRDDKTLAERMADTEKRGGRPVVSALRFRRLLREPFDDLYPEMIRVLRHLNKQANISDLAGSVYYWGDKVRKRWALVYFPKVAD